MGKEKINNKNQNMKNESQKPLTFYEYVKEFHSAKEGGYNQLSDFSKQEQLGLVQEYNGYLRGFNSGNHTKPINKEQLYDDILEILEPLFMNFDNAVSASDKIWDAIIETL